MRIFAQKCRMSALNTCNISERHWHRHLHSFFKTGLFYIESNKFILKYIIVIQIHFFILNAPLLDDIGYSYPINKENVIYFDIVYRKYLQQIFMF